ncbi:hypothetical protein S7335_5156 [Synechococcus sp. PCC 7335]|uniref:DUF4864 domain-containing protein n=1 Tax=Synechococcus sp. (strain ATCC 29403 / PCC 7335) TaxID=91464 RepID=UPI00017EB463|nr:DUF4864 domain-containing protein [Synechococcus sp. PCC 7335]EDX87446.1 hypothetical protein S7335_5156 [Synechococcus sp. PCC 7335]
MEMEEADREAIRQVISLQITAFQQGDVTTAFSQAAPGIQQQFATANNFAAMVEAAYPSVYRPRSVVFENVLKVDDLPAQQVMLMDQAGKLIRATYLMQRQWTGEWKIAGCYLTPMK